MKVRVIELKKAHVYINYHNQEVISMYLKIVEQALIECGYACDYVKSLNSIDKKDLIIFPVGNDAYKFYLKGFRNFAMWQQGVTSEESFLRHGSRIRRFILNYMDSFAMKRAKFILFVSESLRDYYEKIARVDLKKKSYIMPCFNEKFFEDSIVQKEYKKPVFTYVGSLAKWQCFDKTLEIYRNIERNNDDVFLKVLTFQRSEAEDSIKRAGIKHYEVKTVPQEMVKEELEMVNYGFIIRENTIVNRVATPTKISSYLAAGVLPIFSDCLVDFMSQTEELDIALAVGSDESSERIAEEVNTFVARNRTMDDIKAQIRQLFDTYYSVDFHVSKMSSKLKEVLG